MLNWEKAYVTIGKRGCKNSAFDVQNFRGGAIFLLCFGHLGVDDSFVIENGLGKEFLDTDRRKKIFIFERMGRESIMEG